MDLKDWERIGDAGKEAERVMESFRPLPPTSLPGVVAPGLAISLFAILGGIGAILAVLWWTLSDQTETKLAAAPRSTALEREADEARWKCVEAYRVQVHGLVEPHDTYVRQADGGYEVQIEAYLRELDFSAHCRVQSGQVIKLEFERDLPNG